MRKTLSTLAKPYYFALIMVILFVLLRIPSLMEPAWYGDEGIYAAVAHGMRQGQLLYRDIWDHKTPGIFFLYAFAQTISATHQIFIYKLMNLIVGVITLVYSYKLANVLFDRKKEKYAINTVTFLVTILVGSTILEGNIFNAENIFITLTTASVYYLLKWQNKDKSGYISWKQSILLGLLLGFALLMKIHPLFDAAFVIYWIILSWGLRKDLPKLKKFAYTDASAKKALGEIKILSLQILPLLIFFSLPLASFALYYYMTGNWEYFSWAVFKYNTTYSELYEKRSLAYIFLQDSQLLRVILSGIAVIGISLAYHKKKISKRFAFAILWLLFSFVAIKLSSRPYAHYLLQAVVPFSILIAIGINGIAKKNNLYAWFKFSWILLFCYFLINLYTQGQVFVFGYLKPTYYVYGYGYLLGLNDYEKWEPTYNFSADTVRILSDWLKLQKGKKVFIYANQPWQYVLNDFENPGKYTVYFHVNEGNDEELRYLLEKNDAEFIVTEDRRPLPESIKCLLCDDYTPIKSEKLWTEPNGNEGKFTLWERKDVDGKH